MIDQLLLGFDNILTPLSLAWCLFGVVVGTAVGVLPGVGAGTALALLLPLTYKLEPASALVMLSGVYYGTTYGGSTAAILLNVPGHAASAVSCLDGYPLSQQGRGGAALLLVALASFVGGMFGVMLMLAAAPALAASIYHFGSAEYFAVMLFGLVAAASVTTTNTVRNLMMICTGLILGLIGIDINSGATRFTLGIPELSDGINIAIMAMGLFGLAEIIYRFRDLSTWQQMPIPHGSMKPTREEWKSSVPSTARGTAVGSFFGILPGTGPAIASFISYVLEKSLSKTPERFGKGSMPGVVAPEAANNAAAQSAFIPTLTLGVPGDALTALILSALIVQGIAPGPDLVTNNSGIFWTLIASFIVGNIMLLILNVPLIGIWVKMLMMPNWIIYPSIVFFMALGAYAINNSTFNIVLLAVFGLLGYFLRILRFEPAPLLLGFILGPMIEEHFRRALSITNGNFDIFWQSPISAFFLMASAMLLIWALFIKKTQK